AVKAGATHVQGTANGYGERPGNADIFAVVDNLQLKPGFDLVPREALAEMTRIAHAITEVTNVTPNSHAPYVGVSAFAHKAGLHASAIKVDPNLYQHIDPAEVGNDMRMLVSDMAGRASVELKGRELAYDLSPDTSRELVNRVKDLESKGYTFEAPDASFELLLRDTV
ncbi:citramalate synthase, partial [Micromonospora harpali]